METYLFAKARPAHVTTGHTDFDLPGNSAKSAKRWFKSRVDLATLVNIAVEARERPDTTLIPLADVLRMTSLSRSSIYKLANRGDFPAQVVLSANRVAWLKGDIEKWITTRAALRASS